MLGRKQFDLEKLIIGITPLKLRLHSGFPAAIFLLIQTKTFWIGCFFCMLNYEYCVLDIPCSSPLVMVNTNTYVFQLKIKNPVETIMRNILTEERSSLFISLLRNYVYFDRFNNCGSIDVKMDGSVLNNKKLYFKILGLFSIPNWIGILTLHQLLQLFPRILKP